MLDNFRLVYSNLQIIFSTLSHPIELLNNLKKCFQKPAILFSYGKINITKKFHIMYYKKLSLQKGIYSPCTFFGTPGI